MYIYYFPPFLLTLSLLIPGILRFAQIDKIFTWSDTSSHYRLTILSCPNPWICELPPQCHFPRSYIFPLLLLLTHHTVEPFVLHFTNDLFIATSSGLSSEFLLMIPLDMTLLCHLSLSFYDMSFSCVTPSFSFSHIPSLPFSSSSSLPRLATMSILQHSSLLTHPPWRHSLSWLQLPPLRATPTSIFQAQDRAGASRTNSRELIK